MSNWTDPGEPPARYNNQSMPSFSRWNQSAQYCYDTDRDCHNCPNGKLYGLQFGHPTERLRCQMPYAVQQMLNKGLAPTQTAPKVTAFRPSPPVLERVKRLMQQGWTQEGIRALIKQGRETTSFYMTLAAKELGYACVDDFRRANPTQAQLNSPAYSRKKAAVI